MNCPPFADSVTEGDIRWEKAVGDSVKVDDVIGEVETDKVGNRVINRRLHTSRFITLVFSSLYFLGSLRIFDFDLYIVNIAILLYRIFMILLQFWLLGCHVAELALC